MLTPEQEAFALSQPVAHLATAGASGQPHVVPVCFAYHVDRFWIAVDEKPKTTQRLKRVRNIEANPRISLVIDRYDDDWARLAWLLVTGRARVLPRGSDAGPGVLDALRERYPKYRGMALEGRAIIEITPERITQWGAVEPPAP
jgi:PPOX class probable F420-dependent enzyme